MKTVVKLFALGLLALATCSSAMADCQVSISQSTLNYGQIKRGDVVNTVKEWSALAERNVQLNVYCSEAQKMALFFNGQAGDQQVFTLGNSSRLAVVASNAMLDGKSVQLSQTESHGTFVLSGQSRDELPIRNGQGIVPVSGGVAMTGQQLSVTLKVKPALNHNELNVRDKHSLNSAIQIQVETE